MDSEFIGTWKRTLEIQGSRRSAEHVPPAVAGRQISRNRLLQRWLERCQANEMKEKEKVMIEIIITQMEDAAVIAKAILVEEDAEDAEDAEEAAVDAVEEETTIVSI
jgi:hypothetical protein